MSESNHNRFTLQCGLTVSVTETGRTHSTHPYMYFWCVESGKSTHEARGYSETENEAWGKVSVQVKVILSNSRIEMDSIVTKMRK